MIWKAPFAFSVVFSIIFSIVFSVMVLDRGEQDDLEADQARILSESPPDDHPSDNRQSKGRHSKPEFSGVSRGVGLRGAREPLEAEVNHY